MKAFQRLAILVVVGCATAAAAASSAQSRKGYAETVVENGGSIVGTVRFDGATPTPDSVAVTTKEEICHTDPIHSEKLVVSSDGMVRWAVASLKGITTGKAFPEAEEPDERPALDQRGCVFRPHVVVVPRGQPLRILNSDGVLHNVHTWPKKNRSANMAMPGPIKEMKMRFRRAERIRVTCDIHRWMEAWVVVAEHPYYAVSDENGELKLTDVPPGTYTLRLWHETLGEAERQVTVEPETETRVEFTLRQAN
ncbi:MAG: carboxypeptidase regulatory-like domain-containing protein [Planctomycetota bacterium]|jgi:plastocyanin